MPSTKPTADFSYSDEELLNLWREAHAIVSIRGQNYKIGSRDLTSFDLAEIQQTIQYYQDRVDAASGISVNHVRFRRPE